MKKTAIFLATALCTIVACTKQSALDPSKTTRLTGTNGPQAHGYGQTAARFSGPDYSQSIPVDTANRMISSYLNSVGYPTTDVALRSLSFDADTLRAYLANPNIVTVKFMLAHRQSYISSDGYGHSGGLKPNAITLIIVGMNAEDKYVLNKNNGVYDHMYPCPSNCSGSLSGLIE